MLDDISHESPLGKSDHSVILFDYICYAQLKHHKHTRFYYEKDDYRNIGEHIGIGIGIGARSRPSMAF